MTAKRKFLLSTLIVATIAVVYLFTHQPTPQNHLSPEMNTYDALRAALSNSEIHPGCLTADLVNTYPPDVIINYGDLTAYYEQFGCSVPQKLMSTSDDLFQEFYYLPGNLKLSACQGDRFATILNVDKLYVLSKNARVVYASELHHDTEIIFIGKGFVYPRHETWMSHDNYGVSGVSYWQNYRYFSEDSDLPSSPRRPRYFEDINGNQYPPFGDNIFRSESFGRIHNFQQGNNYVPALDLMLSIP